MTVANGQCDDHGHTSGDATWCLSCALDAERVARTVASVGECEVDSVGDRVEGDAPPSPSRGVLVYGFARIAGVTHLYQPRRRGATVRT